MSRKRTVNLFLRNVFVIFCKIFCDFMGQMCTSFITVSTLIQTWNCKIETRCHGIYIR